jgi:hypothetical protein
VVVVVVAAAAAVVVVVVGGWWPWWCGRGGSGSENHSNNGGANQDKVRTGVRRAALCRAHVKQSLGGQHAPRRECEQLLPFSVRKMARGKETACANTPNANHSSKTNTSMKNLL